MRPVSDEDIFRSDSNPAQLNCTELDVIDIKFALSVVQ